ncbi:MAG: LacI family DNA-binding transcriptional regulator [Lentisphaeria bacterium]|nr:LacI family DNA-binding transcriptional regulator [Lentisphaeria bacterium]
MADVAKRAGCSVSMVSYVLRTGEKGSSAPNTREQIMRAVEELGYKTDFAARALRTGKSRIIGVVLPRINQGYLHSLVMELEEAFRNYGYSLFYSYFHSGDERHKSFGDAMDRMSAMNVEAIITPGLQDNMPDMSIPVIIWGNDRKGYDCVYPDKTAFGFDVIKRLYENGHRRILVAGIIEDSRYAAMKEAMCRYGILEQAHFFDGVASAKNAVVVMREIAGMELRPTAVVFHSDEMAVSGIFEAYRLGIKVPQEISVIGYDNLPIGTWVAPMLTTYDQRFDVMAKELARVTVCRLKNPDVPRLSVGIEMNYIERKSFIAITH